jgi:hypothetical protein
MQRQALWAATFVTLLLSASPRMCKADFDIESVFAAPIPWIPGHANEASYVHIVLDQADRPHLIVKVPGLAVYYATRVGTSWLIERIDSTSQPRQVSGFGVDCSIALGTDGVPVAAYFDSYTYTPRLLYNRRGPLDANNNWPSREQIVPSEISVNGPTTMAVDGQSRVHVAYTTMNHLYYVQRIAGIWSAPTLLAATSYTHPSIAIDGSGEPMVAYNDDHRVFIATRSGGVWSRGLAIDPPSNQSDVEPSLAVAPNGDPHVSFRIQGGLLGYGTRHAGLWTWSKRPGDDGAPSCIAFGPPGVPTILHKSGGRLVLTKSYGESWPSETVTDEPIQGDNYWLAVDSEGRSHVAYQVENASGMVIRYAVQTGVAGVEPISPRVRPVGLSISPNPVRAGAEFSIRLERRMGARARIQIVDVQERRVLDRQITLNATGETVVPLTIPGARTGVYFVRVDGETHASGRLVLLR